MNSNELKALVKKHFNLIEADNAAEVSETVVEIQFAVAHLADGTEITNDMEDAFAEGQVLFVVTEEGDKVVAPSGEHVTDSGIAITVDEAGVITGVKHPDEEGEGSLEEAPAEEMSEATEETEADKTEMAEETTEEVETETENFEEEIIEEAVEMDIAEVVEKVIEEVYAPKMEEVYAKLAEMEEKMKEHMSAPAEKSVLESRFSAIKAVKENKSKEAKVFSPKKAQMETVLQAFKNK